MNILSEMFGKRLKRFRKKAGWSQQKLAEKGGLSYADAFGISLGDLVGRGNMSNKILKEQEFLAKGALSERIALFLL